MSQVTASVQDVDLSLLGRMEERELIRFALENFSDRCAIGTSLQKTGIVIIDLASSLQVPFRVFFVDTLLNPPETYDLLAQVEARYGIRIERFEPDPKDLERLYETFGQWPHFLSRGTCCHVRKVLPHNRALASLDTWISGLRADQSDHRKGHAQRASLVCDPTGRPILKLNPLLHWTDEQIERYTREHNLPYNKLYDYVSPFGERYTVIGCAACHIPIKDRFDRRAGKFPWEAGKKECGLHKDGSGI